MIIEGTCGKKMVGSSDELLHLLRSSQNGDFAEFWLGDKKHPVMVIFTHGNLAYLHYLPADGHPSFQAVGGFDADGEVTFKQAGQGDLSMPRAFVVGVEQAYQAAAEFFTSLSLPSCIKWTEL